MNDNNLQDNELFSRIKGLITEAKQRASASVNAELTVLYRKVGKHIGSMLYERTAISKRPDQVIDLPSLA